MTGPSDTTLPGSAPSASDRAAFVRAVSKFESINCSLLMPIQACFFAAASRARSQFLASRPSDGRSLADRTEYVDVGLVLRQNCKRNRYRAACAVAWIFNEHQRPRLPPSLGAVRPRMASPSNISMHWSTRSISSSSADIAVATAAESRHRLASSKR